MWEDGAGEFHGAVAYERWPYSLQAQPNGSSDGVALCWRLEGCDEPSTRRVGVMLRLNSGLLLLACLGASVLQDASYGCQLDAEGADSAVSDHSDWFLRHAIALVHSCLRHDYVQGALIPCAQEPSMQCRQLLDDASAARTRAPMRYRITGADAVGAVAATSNGRRCSSL